jgi:triphosphoribosyl-dephospho-CoA synthase
MIGFARSRPLATWRREEDAAPSTALELASMAVSVLIEEAELTPKPGLVDQRGSGAHHDLDIDSLRSSALSLKDGFAAIARAAARSGAALALREELGRIGREMEVRMLAATGGSNAHRGAIWALGLLVAVRARHPGLVNAAAIAAAAGRLARLPDRFVPYLASHGECVRQRYGVSGARGEACAGFPHAVHIGLPALRAARARGVREDLARCDALMAIMARLQDTCLLHRGGIAALQTAQAGARAVRRVGGTASAAGRRRLYALHAALMALWASPGGSADLLAVTLFLDRCCRHAPRAGAKTMDVRGTTNVADTSESADGTLRE